MALKFPNILNKIEPGCVVTEPKQFPISQARERFFQSLFPKESSSSLSVPQRLVIEHVKVNLQKKEVRQKAVPRLPSVIPKLLRSLRDPESSVKDYVNIINKDPMMSAAVLKLANSAYFNPIAKRIGDVELAVVKLGIDGLRSVLSAAVMQPIIQRESAYFSHAGKKIWQHSLNCAVACELIAEQRGAEKFKMYLMGLSHDVGNITIFSELCKQFKMNGEKQDPGYNAFVPLMRSLSNALSFWVARDWDLPKDICKALAEQIGIKAGREVSVHGEILYQANLVTELYATLYEKNKRFAEGILEEMGLPKDLFFKLEQVSSDL